MLAPATKLLLGRLSGAWLLLLRAIWFAAEIIDIVVLLLAVIGLQWRGFRFLFCHRRLLLFGYKEKGRTANWFKSKLEVSVKQRGVLGQFI